MGSRALYVCAALIFAQSQIFGASYIYQEPLGAPYPYQLVAGPMQYVGVRFQLDQPTQLTSLHTVFGASDSTFFAALVSLPTVTSLPQGNPFSPGEVLFSTVFQSPSFYPLLPIDIPFNVTVGPGAYGVILGAGQFGSGTDWGGVDTYESVSSTEFFWLDGSHSTPGWHDESAYDPSDRVTILMNVEGTVVPEPSVAGLAGLAVAGTAWTRFRKRAGG